MFLIANWIVPRLWHCRMSVKSCEWFWCFRDTNVCSSLILATFTLQCLNATFLSVQPLFEVNTKMFTTSPIIVYYKYRGVHSRGRLLASPTSASLSAFPMLLDNSWLARPAVTLARELRPRASRCAQAVDRWTPSPPLLPYDLLKPKKVIMVVPDSVKEKVGELPDISGMSKVRTVKNPESVFDF